MRKNKKDNEKNKKNLNVVVIVALATFAITFVMGTLFYLKSILIPKGPFYELESRISDAEATKIADATTIGWIRVQGTNIEYPLIYETQNAYNSGEDYIWIPHIPDDGENRMAIYGHNIQNISSEPLIADPSHKRFEQLMSFTDKTFAKNNQYIQLTIFGKETLYKIYAVEFVAYEEDYGQNTKSTEEAKQYIDNVKEESLYDYDVEVSETDELISLITCTRYFGNTGKKQFKIDARKVRENEKLEKSNVKTNNNYDIIK